MVSPLLLFVSVEIEKKVTHTYCKRNVLARLYWVRYLSQYIPVSIVEEQLLPWTDVLERDESNAHSASGRNWREQGNVCTSCRMVDVLSDGIRPQGRIDVDSMGL